jgi:hypothetical protein
MPFCTGQGYPDEPGGCCHLGDGTVCPHYKSGAEVLDWVNNVGWKGAALSRARNMAQGVKHACDIAITVVANNSQAINNRSLFEQLWTDHPQYVADVRPYWDTHEDKYDLPRGSYNCATWKSDYVIDNVCCWGQDDATCDAQAEVLHSTAVTLRRAGGL